MQETVCADSYDHGEGVSDEPGIQEDEFQVQFSTYFHMQLQNER